MNSSERNLPQSLIGLEFKDQEPTSFCSDDQAFEKILHRHWKDADFFESQINWKEEYQNLRHAALEMSEAEMAYHLMMQMRNKLICAYRHLLSKGHRA